MLLATLRHGDTDWSLEGRIQGRTDIPLSAKGRAQVANCRLPGECHGMRVVSSPLSRCVETASLLGLDEFAIDARLAEMGWGEWEGRRLAELREELGESMRENEARGMDFTPPGGECPRHVLQRVREWLGEVATRGAPTLAIAHRGVIRGIFAAAYGWDMRGRPPLKLDWRAVHLFRLDAAGNPSPFRMNVPLVDTRASIT